MPFDFNDYRARLKAQRDAAADAERQRKARVRPIVSSLMETIGAELSGYAVDAGEGWVRARPPRSWKSIVVYVDDDDQYAFNYGDGDPDRRTARSASEDEIMQAVLDWPQRLRDEERRQFESQFEP